MFGDQDSYFIEFVFILLNIKYIELLNILTLKSSQFKLLANIFSRLFFQRNLFRMAATRLTQFTCIVCVFVWLGFEFKKGVSKCPLTVGPGRCRHHHITCHGC